MVPVLVIVVTSSGCNACILERLVPVLQNIIPDAKIDDIKDPGLVYLDHWF